MVGSVVLLKFLVSPACLRFVAHVFMGLEYCMGLNKVRVQLHFTLMCDL